MQQYVTLPQRPGRSHKVDTAPASLTWRLTDELATRLRSVSERFATVSEISLIFKVQAYDFHDISVLFDFYVPSTTFQLCRDGSSWVEPVLS